MGGWVDGWVLVCCPLDLCKITQGDPGTGWQLSYASDDGWESTWLFADIQSIFHQCFPLKTTIDNTFGNNGPADQQTNRPADPTDPTVESWEELVNGCWLTRRHTHLVNAAFLWRIRTPSPRYQSGAFLAFPFKCTLPGSGCVRPGPQKHHKYHTTITKIWWKTISVKIYERTNDLSQM